MFKRPSSTEMKESAINDNTWTWRPSSAPEQRFSLVIKSQVQIIVLTAVGINKVTQLVNLIFISKLPPKLVVHLTIIFILLKKPRRTKQRRKEVQYAQA